MQYQYGTIQRMKFLPTQDRMTYTTPFEWHMGKSQAAVHMPDILPLQEDAHRYHHQLWPVQNKYFLILGIPVAQEQMIHVLSNHDPSAPDSMGRNHQQLRHHNGRQSQASTFQLLDLICIGQGLSFKCS